MFHSDSAGEQKHSRISQNGPCRLCTLFQPEKLSSAKVLMDFLVLAYSLGLSRSDEDGSSQLKRKELSACSVNNAFLETMLGDP